MGISDKQRQILAFPFTKYDALICDGAIRSGKTTFMTIAFIDDAMRRYNNKVFGICGKTVETTIKNIITPYISLSYSQKKYGLKWKKQEKILVVSCGDVKNHFEVFGGKDESSFMYVQGRTFAGVFFDETALLPKSFVDQACARCSVDGSRMWFNCNPESPEHWFYKEWICDLKKHNAIRLSFRLEDNPALSEKIIQRYKSMYTGVFFDRYILGLWCVAEGLVYNFGEDNITDDIPQNGEYYISIDYGTLNPFSAGLWCVLGGQAVRIKEYYYNGREKGVQKTDEDYCESIAELSKGYNIRQIIIDPSAASFKAALRKRGFKTRDANNDVLDGIRRTAVFLKNGNIKIHRSCADSISEFGLYRWDDKAASDTVIKEHDHAMDDIRYFCNTIMKHKVGKTYETIGIYN